MTLRTVDGSFLNRLQARHEALRELLVACRVCGREFVTREGFDPLCDECAEEERPLRKLLRHHATIDRRPAVMEAGEVPVRYRCPWADLAVWPVDPLRPVDLRSWPEIRADRSVADGEPWALTIRGECYTGKTRLAVELAVRIALRRRCEMLFIAAAQITDALHDPDPLVYQRLERVPVLVVDDLGRGYSGGQGQAVQRLICTRYNWLRTSIFTTNAGEDGFDDPAVIIRLGEGLQVEMTEENRGSA